MNNALYALLIKLQKEISSNLSSNINVINEIEELKEKKLEVSFHDPNKCLVTDNNGDIVTSDFVPSLSDDGVLYFSVSITDKS